MLPLLLVLLLIIVLFGGGIGAGIQILWIIAIVLLVLWLAGFLMRGAEGARWYRW